MPVIFPSATVVPTKGVSAVLTKSGIRMVKLVTANTTISNGHVTHHLSPFLSASYSARAAFKRSKKISRSLAISVPNL